MDYRTQTGSTSYSTDTMANVLTNSPHKIIPNVIIGSPVRPLRFDMTPMSPMSPGFGDCYPWKWHESARNVDFSPISRTPSHRNTSTCSSPRTPGSECTTPSPRTRGRPRAESIPELQLEGTVPITVGIRCRICSRVFPREKSLQAHMRTHTGERPYICDYPNCGRAFVQSGQLKTHQRLHTGEKPFACSAEDCPSRFTHANRHCTDHPFASLKRVTTEVALEDLNFKMDENSAEVIEWLHRYADLQRSRSQASQEKKSSKRKTSTSEGEYQDITDTPKRPRVTARRRLQEQRDKLMGAMALIELAEQMPGL